MIIRLNIAFVLLLMVSACSSVAGFTHIRTPEYAAYMPGDALLAANNSPIKIVVLPQTSSGGDTDQQVAASAAAIVAGLEQYGPRWFVAHYSAAPDLVANEGYELRWVLNSPENKNEDRLCYPDYAREITLAEQHTGVVIAAFCRGNTRLSSIRARIWERPDSEKFRETVGLMGRYLMPVRNPERIENCRNLEDCL
ncbi:hypothetical protein [Kiloniella laminariae]|uniref:hypothetical protein n=1 Tax=Kiloniella laminariae TaxID=454162 RepID=UPI00037ED402|nr:hypothetical protein [Kiloniella laminariae]